MVRSLVLPRSFAYFVLILSLTLSARASHAQGISPDPARTPSSTTSASNGSTSSSITHTVPDPADLNVSWHKVSARFLPDEKDIWLSPTKVGKDTHLLPPAMAVGGLASFIKDDTRLDRNVRRTDILSEDTTPLPGPSERDASREDWAGQGATGSSPQAQIQPQGSGHEGLVMRSVKRILQDQKELYLTPFKPSNFKWDALELGGTAALIASDRHIEKHIGTDHYNFYQATSDVAIAGLGATLAGVWAWGIKGDHPHAKETGVLELETLVDTMLIYTPTQLLAARQRPGEGNGNGDFWKHHNINTSFPGGHAMFTFAMATVVSHEYPQWWVQALAYLAATTVTVTRFMARDHWSSDMFIGTALGIGIGAHTFHAHCNPELSDSCKHHKRWIF